MRRTAASSSRAASCRRCSNWPVRRHLHRLYHELFGWEPRGKCLHSPTYPPVREVLATAKAAGAVVVFAHPTVYKSMPLLRELVAEGAIDGIEVHHPRNSPEDRPSALSSARSTTSSSPAAATSTARTTANPTGGCLRHRGRPDRAHRGTGPQAPGRRSMTGSH